MQLLLPTVSYMHKMLIAVTIYIWDQSIYIYTEKANSLDIWASIRPVSNFFLVRAYLCKFVHYWWFIIRTIVYDSEQKKNVNAVFQS